jgi:hypothetical protein
LRIEVREVKTRCAASGLIGTIVFARERQTEKFRIRLISKEADSLVKRAWARLEAEKAEAERAARQAANALTIAGVAERLVAWGQEQLNTWRGVEADVDDKAGLGTTEGAPPDLENNQAFDGKEFDWSGFTCPHCQAGLLPSYENGEVINCGSCRELVCAARLVDIGNRRRTFRCHDGCSGSGVVNEGFFEVRGAKLSLESGERARVIPDPAIPKEAQKPLSDDARKALPRPAGTGLMRRRGEP